MTEKNKTSLEADLDEVMEKTANKIAKGPKKRKEEPKMDKRKKKDDGKVSCPHCGKRYKNLNAHKCKKAPESVAASTCEGCICNSGKGKRVNCDINAKIGDKLCKKYGKKRSRASK